MNAFLYGIALQWRLDMRSKSLLVACYLVPLLFFLFMGGIFTSVMPDMKNTLTQSMIVMSVSMGAFTGFPPSLAETYGTDIQKVYLANRVPFCFGLVASLPAHSCYSPHRRLFHLSCKPRACEWLVRPH